MAALVGLELHRFAGWIYPGQHIRLQSISIMLLPRILSAAEDMPVS
jgi:hypothetical protein